MVRREYVDVSVGLSAVDGLGFGAVYSIGAMGGCELRCRVRDGSGSLYVVYDGELYKVEALDFISQVKLGLFKRCE